MPKLVIRDHNKFGLSRFVWAILISIIMIIIFYLTQNNQHLKITNN
jgi:hypothetical protein